MHNHVDLNSQLAVDIAYLSGPALAGPLSGSGGAQLARCC